VGGHVTRYARRGTGHPVVVLRGAADDASLWPSLVGQLASRWRVIIPQPPEGDAGLVSWVGGFLDGVGLSPVTVIAAGRFCAPALEFALLDGDRLAGLVLVPGGPAEHTGLTGSLGTTARSGLSPVLVVRRECPSGNARALVERFVATTLP
jgi:pimeloyl-ACP methyl ester carboxylesterase